MKLYKPKFWDTKKSFLSTILLPLSLVFAFAIFLKKRFVKKLEFEIPIICVGNIYLGGTGKTPTSIFIAKELKLKGKNPVIVRKYYKEHIDEYKLITNNFKNPIIKKNRVKGVEEAICKNYDSVILDDGFQDYQIHKKLNILCFNSNQLTGNSLLFPSGPLREDLSSLKNAQIIIINGEKNDEFEKKIYDIKKNIKIFYSKYSAINIDEFRDKKLFAVAGIGNPENFFQILKKNNLDVKREFKFPDHYNYSKSEIDKIIEEAKRENCQIVMTEKDFLRIEDFNLDMIKCLKVKLDVKDKEKFIENIIKGIK